ncbi:MAG TPA: PQQ-binding-like beta-propeller repeat protein [Acidimicrobiia bacterium]
MEEREIVGGEDLDEALETSRSTGRPTLLLVESDDGLAGPVIDRIPDSAKPLRRAVGAKATRAKIGCVADILNLEEAEGGAIVVENAQFVDATSLGRIRRLLKREDPGRLIVVAHTPVAPEDSWWLDDLATTARDHGTLMTIEGSGSGESPVAPVAEDVERTLVLASQLVSEPIPVAVAARLLEVTESEAIAVAENLIGRGLLAEDRSGFQASPAGRVVDAGAARLGHVAGRLATAFAAAGEDQAVIGALHRAAGDDQAAYPLLRDAARDAQGTALGEAYHLATEALAAADSADLGTEAELGELHLICGRHLRAVGRSDAASAHLEEAVTQLEGAARIDALGFAASVADDRQHPQEAERILAVAEWEAIHQNELAKLGSLGTFRARALNRIGFAAESDAILSKASAILDEHATPVQQFYAAVNRAWILFDRGQVSRAESEFTHLRDMTDRHDLAGLADKEAWRARALFATGHPHQALDAVEAAREHASNADVEAPIFLAELALTEGALLTGRPQDALQSSERVLDMVDRILPAWENVARSNRALALLRLGRTSDAEEEIEIALAVTPPGADGWRWRSRCRAIQMEIQGVSSSFPQHDAEDLADMFLQSEYYGWAAELLCVIAENTRSNEAAREALALATQIGNLMLAARAAEAGDLWGEPVTAPTIRGIRSMEMRLPDEWVDEWRSSPAVAAALAAPEPDVDETGAENSEALQEALRRAGLVSADTILSPAQRRSGGLVRHRRRRRRPLVMLAAALGVIVLTVGTSLVVAQLTQPDPIPEAAATALPENPGTTEAAPLRLEETEIDVPVDLLFGTSLDRGDPGRSGHFEVSGPRTVDGYYWVYQAAGAIGATPLSYGNNLLVGSNDGTYQAIDLTLGDSVWSMTAEAPIATSGSLGTSSVGEGGSAGLVVVVADDGVVRARHAVIVEESERWNQRLGGRIRSSPVVDDERVYVATTDGQVHAIDLGTGEVLWTYPGPDAEPLGAITAGLALDNGIIYAGTETGGLHLINTDGTLHCETRLDGSIRVNPVVTDGRAYIAFGSLLRVFPAGVCEQLVSEAVQYLSETVIEVAPAVVGDLMYIPNGIFLNAIDRKAVEEGVSDPLDVHHWSPGQVRANGKIASPPVVTDDAVYFGTETGWVYAVDADTGELLWQWQTESYVRASPVVVDGAVYIASGDGRVYAVGPSG